MLVKDPFALFSSEWLAERFELSIVVVIRHPAAFVSSIIKLGWSHPLSHFLEQPSLLQERLAPFTDEIRAYAAGGHEVVENYSSSTNPGDLDAPVGSKTTLKRDSEANIWNWKKRLTGSEIESVRSGEEFHG